MGMPEEQVSLAHAFTAAGARNVVSTSWPVQDAVSAAIATHFYEQLWEDNLNVPQAVQGPQQRIRDGVGAVGSLSTNFMPELRLQDDVR
jgi:CHAT domain-containing protein